MNVTRILREKFKDITLTKKMLLVYVGFGGIFFAVSLLAFQVSTDIFEQRMYENSIRELDYYVKDVKDSMTAVEERSYEMLIDDAMQETLVAMQEAEPDTLAYNQLLTSIRWNLVNSRSLTSDIQLVRYIDPYGKSVESGNASTDITDRAWAEFLEEVEASRGEAVFYGPTEECPYLLCGRKMLKWSDMSLDDMGSLVLVCDMGRMIARNKSDFEADHASLFVYTEDYVIYQDMEELPAVLPGNVKGQGYQILTWQGEKYFLCYLNSTGMGWTYVNFFPYSDVYGQISAVRFFVILSFCVAFVLLLYLIHRTAEIITKPLETLVRSMQVVETGDFQSAKLIPMDGERKDEVGVLTKEFQVMLDKIDVLLRENYEKQLLLKDTKYKMLQAQINPHFLYNTLNAIHWMIRAGENEKAGRMIVELGTLLRASFDANPYTTVEEETAMLRSYINIQQYRYEDRASFTVHKTGNLDNYVMPRMTLQPLVENAIFYGADMMQDICRIDVTIEEEEQHIRFEVRDNGPGMTEEELAAVQSFTVKPKGHGIGLKNIYERLNIIFETFEFQIDSKQGMGTSIVIRVPRQTAEGEKHV